MPKFLMKALILAASRAASRVPVPPSVCEQPIDEMSTHHVRTPSLMKAFAFYARGTHTHSAATFSVASSNRQRGRVI